jgi:hypothetical protein
MLMDFGDAATKVVIPATSTKASGAAASSAGGGGAGLITGLIAGGLVGGPVGATVGGIVGLVLSKKKSVKDVAQDALEKVARGKMTADEAAALITMSAIDQRQRAQSAILAGQIGSGLKPQPIDASTAADAADTAKAVTVEVAGKAAAAAQVVVKAAAAAAVAVVAGGGSALAAGGAASAAISSAASSAAGAVSSAASAAVAAIPFALPLAVVAGWILALTLSGGHSITDPAELAAYAAARGMTVEQLQALIKKGLIDGATARREIYSEGVAGRIV